jgi:MoxR-like ATPase
MSEYDVFTTDPEPRDIATWPTPPPWRMRRGDLTLARRIIPPADSASTFRVTPAIAAQVNAAIHLRRPLLVTGKPGTGKSSLARAIAHRLKLGRLLVWPINSRSTRQEGLWHYDAIGRLQDVSIAERSRKDGQPGTSAHGIGRYIRLGPLGTAMLPGLRPRVLLIDEVDKSDIDLPNDLLHVFEEGEFHVPELSRDAQRAVMVRPAEGDDSRSASGEELIQIHDGIVRCHEYPIIVMTSNGEREFPPAFRRRCIPVTMPEPNKAELEEIVKAHFAGTDILSQAKPLIEQFLERRQTGSLATDQLLNTILIRLRGGLAGEQGDGLLNSSLLRSLTDVQ